VNASDADSLIRDGLAAWTIGDLDAIELLLDPAVTLKALRPGPWGCQDRDAVMSLLRLRDDQGQRSDLGTVEVLRLDEATFAVSGLAGGSDVAMLITIEARTPRQRWQRSAPAISRPSQSSSPPIRTSLGRGSRVTKDEPCCTLPPTGPAISPMALRSCGCSSSAGADPNDRGGVDEHGETPLRWPASSDDVDVARWC
jgi:hypothetical protein